MRRPPDHAPRPTQGPILSWPSAKLSGRRARDQTKGVLRAGLREPSRGLPLVCSARPTTICSQPLSKRGRRAVLRQGRSIGGMTVKGIAPARFNVQLRLPTNRKGVAANAGAPKFDSALRPRFFRRGPAS